MGEKLIQWLPVPVIIAGLVVVVHYVVQDRNDKAQTEEPVSVTAEKVASEALPVAETASPQVRERVVEYFSDPEKLDQAPVAESSALIVSAPRPVPAAPVSLKNVSERPVPAGTEPVEPYFRDEFVSLRSDEIRNPDSDENQAIIRSLMQKRQARLELRKTAKQFKEAL